MTLQDLLTGALQPGVFRVPARASLREVQQVAERSGWRVYRLRGRHITDKLSFLAESARGLNFPKYFGHNWDAFEESFSDLAYGTGERTLVIFDYAGRFAAAEPEAFATALDILQSASVTRRTSGSPLAVILQGAARAADVVRIQV